MRTYFKRLIHMDWYKNNSLCLVPLHTFSALSLLLCTWSYLRILISFTLNCMQFIQTCHATRRPLRLPMAVWKWQKLTPEEMLLNLLSSLSIFYKIPFGLFFTDKEKSKCFMALSVMNPNESMFLTVGWMNRWITLRIWVQVKFFYRFPSKLFKINMRISIIPQLHTTILSISNIVLPCVNEFPEMEVYLFIHARI